jgi:FtsH-binding integral membrane protein
VTEAEPKRRDRLSAREVFREVGVILLALLLLSVGVSWLASKSDESRCSDLSGPCKSRYHFGRAFFLALAFADLVCVVVCAALARRNSRRASVVGAAVFVLGAAVVFVVALWVFTATDMTD